MLFGGIEELLIFDKNYFLNQLLKMCIINIDFNFDQYNDNVMHSIFTDDEIAEMNEDRLLVVH